jgi:spore maturation protein SpmB
MAAVFIFMKWLNTLLQSLKPAINKFIKGEAIKLALRKILGSSTASGLRAWIIKFIASELYEELFKPILLYGIRKKMLIIDKSTGALIVNRVQRAKDEGDETSYTDTISDI